MKATHAEVMDAQVRIRSLDKSWTQSDVTRAITFRCVDASRTTTFGGECMQPTSQAGATDRNQHRSKTDRNRTSARMHFWNTTFATSEIELRRRRQAGQGPSTKPRAFTTMPTRPTSNAHFSNIPASADARPHQPRTNWLADFAKPTTPRECNLGSF